MTNQRAMVRIDGQVPWSIQRTDNGCYVGVCDDLNISMQGDTWADLMNSIAESLNLLFRDLCESGELDKFLREKGWNAQGEPGEDARFDIPFIPSFLTASGTDAHDPANAVH